METQIILDHPSMLQSFCFQLFGENLPDNGLCVSACKLSVAVGAIGLKGHLTVKILQPCCNSHQLCLCIQPFVLKENYHQQVILVTLPIEKLIVNMLTLAETFHFELNNFD